MTKTTDNTNRVIDYFVGHPEEFSMLKGLLIATHAMDAAAAKKFEAMIDPALIAARMDAINR